jgi:hypothetical protein
VAGSFLGIDFLRKFRITVAPETSQVLFACTATAPAAAILFLPNVSQAAEPSVFVPSAAAPLQRNNPNSVPKDVKRLLKKFPYLLSTGDVMSTPTRGVEHHKLLVTALARASAPFRCDSSSIWLSFLNSMCRC